MWEKIHIYVNLHHIYVYSYSIHFAIPHLRESIASSGAWLRSLRIPWLAFYCMNIPSPWLAFYCMNIPSRFIFSSIFCVWPFLHLNCHLWLLQASKVALVIFERDSRWRDNEITMVAPGLIESESTKGKFLSKEGKNGIGSRMGDAN